MSCRKQLDAGVACRAPRTSTSTIIALGCFASKLYRRDLTGAPNTAAFELHYQAMQTVHLPSGLKLEVHLSAPVSNNTTNERKLAVCLHPWSWLGGRMNDPCVPFGYPIVQRED